jgi:hypothetical protein
MIACEVGKTPKGAQDEAKEFSINRTSMGFNR